MIQTAFAVIGLTKSVPVLTGVCPFSTTEQCTAVLSFEYQRLRPHLRFQVVNRRLFQTVQSRADSAARLAADYLANNFRYLTEVYDICLVSYALHVAGHRDRAFAFQKLEEIKIDGECSC